LFPSNKFIEDSVASDALKEVGNIYKKGGAEMDSEWMFFVDWHTMTGYVDPKTPLDLFEEAVSWVRGVRSYHPNMIKSHDERIILLEALIEKVPVIKHGLNVDDFLRNPSLWATTGSGRGLSDKLRVRAEYWDGKQRRWVKNGIYKFGSMKWTNAIASDLSRLRELMFSRSKQHNYMFIKEDEKGGMKLRSIVVGDFANYLRMAYLNWFFMKAFKNIPAMPISWDDVMRQNKMSEMLELSGDTDVVKMPVDQKEFDKNVSTNLVLASVDFIGRVSARVGMSAENRNEYIDDLRLVSELLLYSMDGGVLEIDDGRVVAIERGVLSGWLFTAIIDSLANYIQFKEIQLAMRVDDKNVKFQAFQGDDIALGFNGIESAVAIYVGYEKYGLKINPLKFWIEDNRDEFLRLVSTKNKVRGYLARLVTGFLYMKPGTPSSTEDAWFELLDSWKKAVSRGANAVVVQNYIIQECTRLFSISSSVAEIMLYTPRTFNGGGWGLKKVDRYIGVDMDASRRAKIVGGDFPLWSNYTKDEQVALANKYLSPLLPTRRFVSREFKVKPYHLSEDKSMFLGAVDPVDFPMDVRVPKALWNVELPNARIVLVDKFIKGEMDIVALSTQFSNSDIVLGAYQVLGKRNFLKWIEGPLYSVPLSITAPVMIKNYVKYLFLNYWSKIKRLTLNKVLFYIEVTTLYSLEKIYTKSASIYGH
jgi:hypothetical protein